MSGPADGLAHYVCGAVAHVLEIASREGWAAAEIHATWLEEKLHDYEVALLGDENAAVRRRERAGLRR